jgi:hypothetical protein
MSNNNLAIIPNNSFIYFKELVVLDLSKDKIKIYQVIHFMDSYFNYYTKERNFLEFSPTRIICLDELIFPL